MPKNRKTNTAIAVALLGAVAAAGAAGGVLSSKSLLATTALTAPALSDSRALPGSFAPVIERVGPAVVSIRVTGAAQPGARMTEVPQMEIPEPFKRFFGEDFEKRFGFRFGPSEDGVPQPQRRAPRVQGMGSGFFIDADGHVVTNNHVVSDADKIEIMLNDGKTYDASLVGRDPKTDLALLKVKSDRAFPFVSFGDSEAAKVGDWVIAVGSPFGLGHTATTGIVSARGRDIGAGPYDDFLQIDAAINRGNSGGPAFNVNGEVIGVNTAIISPTGTNAGIGFAIPANIAKNVIAQLKEKGAVTRGWLGVNIQPVSEDIAQGLGLGKAEGALVADVTGDSPAAQAGIRQGDVIVAVGDERIEQLRELPRLIAEIPVDRIAKLTVIRDGRERTIDVRIGKMPETDKMAATEPEQKPETDRLGLSLAALDDNLRAKFRIPRDADGVVVVDVDRDSVSAEKGILPGDVIRQAAGQPVRKPADITEAIERAGKGNRKALLMLVTRNGNDRYVALPLRDA